MLSPLNIDDVVHTTLCTSTASALKLLHVSYPENPDAHAETERQLRIQTRAPLTHHHIAISTAIIAFPREMAKHMALHPERPVYRVVAIDYETYQISLAPAPEWVESVGEASPTAAQSVPPAYHPV